MVRCGKFCTLSAAARRFSSHFFAMQSSVAPNSGGMEKELKQVTIMHDANQVRASLAAALDFGKPEANIAADVDGFAIEMAVEMEFDPCCDATMAPHDEGGWSAICRREIAAQQKRETLKIEHLLAALAVVSIIVAASINSFGAAQADPLSLFEVEMQLSKAQACMPAVARQNAIRQTLTQRLKKAASPFEQVLVVAMIVDMKNEMCIGDAGQPGQLETPSSATADVQFMMDFSSKEDAVLDKVAFSNLPGINAIEANNGNQVASDTQRNLARWIGGAGGLLLIIGTWLIISTHEDERATRAKDVNIDFEIQLAEIAAHEC